MNPEDYIGNTQMIATLDVQSILNEIEMHTFSNFLGLSIDFAPQKQNVISNTLAKRIQ